MPEINLLPIDLSPNRDSVKTVSTVKKIIIGLTFLIILITATGGGLIIFLSNKVQTSIARSTSLKQQIQSLQQTEQQLFVVKDRVDKISTAKSDTDLVTPFENVDKILSNLPTNVSVDTLQISLASTRFSVVSTDSLGMASFLNSLVTNKTYKNLSLKGFVFAPLSGYKITLEGS